MKGLISFVILISALMANSSIAGELGEYGEYKVHLPISLGDSQTAAKVCQLLLRTLGEKPEHRALTEGPLSVHLLEESFVDTPERKDWLVNVGADKQRLDPKLLALSTELSRARMRNGQRVKLAGPNETFAGRHYQDVTGFEFGVRAGSREYRVQLRPRIVDGGWAQTEPGVFVETPQFPSWVWMIGDDFALPLDITRVTEKSPHLYLLDGLSHMQMSLPRSTVDRLLSYDLKREALGLPHDSGGENFYLQLSNNLDQSMSFGEPQFFVIRDVKNSGIKGFLAVLDLTLTNEYQDNSGLFRNHFASGSRFTTEVNSVTYRYLAHFDSEGHRVEAWNSRLTDPPHGTPSAGRLEQTEFDVWKGAPRRRGVKKKVIPAPARELPPESPRIFAKLEVAPKNVSANRLPDAWSRAAVAGSLIKKPADWEKWGIGYAKDINLIHSPNGRYLLVTGSNQALLMDLRDGKKAADYGLNEEITAATFSQSGEELFLGHPKNWVSIIDVKTGKQKDRFLVDDRAHMASKSATKIIPLGNFAFAVTMSKTVSEDETSFIVFRDSGATTSLEKGFDLRAVSESSLYFYHYYNGLKIIPFSLNDSSIDFGGVGGSVSHGRKFMANYGQQMPYTKRRNFSLLSPLGDHFIAFDNDSQSSGLYRYALDGLYELFHLSEAERLQRWASTNTRKDGSSWIASLSSDGYGLIRAVTQSGKSKHDLTVGVSKPKTLKNQKVATNLIFSNNGNLLALAHNGSISIWELSGDKPRQVNEVSIPTSRKLIHLEFSKDDHSIVYLDEDHSIGSIFSEPRAKL